MLILGINMLHPDCSAALIEDGKIVFAIAEERLNRKKHYAGMPFEAVKECLRYAGITMADIDHIAVGRDPKANRGEKVKYALKNPKQLSGYVGLARRAEKYEDPKSEFANALDVDPETIKCEQHYVEHHVAHIASAYFTSPWEHAAGLSYDGSGDFVTTMMAECRGNKIDVLRRVFVPDSLGYLYTMVCEFIGYRKYGDEGKVMGLAPYGTDALYPRLAELIAETEDGFRLNKNFFMPFGSGLQIGPDRVQRKRRFSDHMVDVFGPAREPNGELTDRDKDLAWAVQRRFEEVAFHLMNKLHRDVPVNRLAMAGGASLNSVTNGKLLLETPFDETHIHPAAGDDGIAVGAALYVYHHVLGHPRKEHTKTAYLGQDWNDSSIKSALEARNVTFKKLERHELLDNVSGRIADGDVVGWFQGRMEWGPRALGNRSILAHPGRPDMKDILNARIKRREWYRPFAPSILAERQAEYFEQTHPSPFMLHVYKIQADKRKELCAVNHADDTGRLQSVSRDENELYYDLISEFDKKTGTPVVLNTSFNENEPVVCRPEEAVDCFLRTKMDTLAIGPFFAQKTMQDSDN